MGVGARVIGLVVILGVLFGGPWNGKAAAWCHPQGNACFTDAFPDADYSCHSEIRTGDIKGAVSCAVNIYTTPQLAAILPAAEQLGPTAVPSTTPATVTPTGTFVTTSSASPTATALVGPASDAPTASAGAHGRVTVDLTETQPGMDLDYSFVLDQNANMVSWDNSSVRVNGHFGGNSSHQVFTFDFTLDAHPSAPGTFIGIVIWDAHGGEDRGWVGFNVAPASTGGGGDWGNLSLLQILGLAGGALVLIAIVVYLIKKLGGGGSP